LEVQKFIDENGIDLFGQKFKCACVKLSVDADSSSSFGKRPVRTATAVASWSSVAAAVQKWLADAGLVGWGAFVK